MSTKIYTGVRFNVRNIADLHAKTSEWRKRIEILTEESKLKFFAEIIMTSIDRAVLGTSVEDWPDDKKIMSYASRTYTERLEKTKEKYANRDPAVDMDFSFSVHPVGRYLYGVVFCDRSEWLDEFMKLPWVEEFAYWNNTDPPEHLTTRQWKRRERIWEQAIPDHFSNIPARSGFVAECGDELGQSSYVLRSDRRQDISLGQIMREATMKYIVPTSERYTRYVPTLLYRKFVDLQAGAFTDKTEYKRYDAFKQWRESNASKSYEYEIEEKVKSTLIEIKIDHLEMTKNEIIALRNSK